MASAGARSARRGSRIGPEGRDRMLVLLRPTEGARRRSRPDGEGRRGGAAVKGRAGGRPGARWIHRTNSGGGGAEAQRGAAADGQDAAVELRGGPCRGARGGGRARR